MKQPALTRAFQFYQVCRYGALVLIGVILAKTGFSTSEIGVFETVILVSGVTSFFWLNGLLNTYVAQSSSQGSGTRALYSGTAVLTLFVIVLLILARPLLSDWLALDDTGFFLLLLFILLNNTSFITEHILLVREQARSLTGLALAHAILLPLMVLLAALYLTGMEAVILAMCLFLLGKNLFLLLLKPFTPNGVSTRELLLSASPLIGSFFFGGISVYVDGIIVNSHFDKGAFAVYQYGAREFPVALLLANAFSMVMVRALGQHRSDGLRETKAGSLRMMHRLIPLGILLMLSSKWIFPAVFNAQFSDSYVYFNIYLLLLIPRLIFPQSVLIAGGQTRVQLYISIAEFVVNITSSLLLMQVMGLAGIAFGTVIAFVLEKLCMVFYLQHQGIQPGSYIPLNWLMLYSFLLLSVFLMSTLAVL